MMGWELCQVAAIAVVMCAAAMLQSAVGFGYALLATPLLLWLGAPLPQAVVIIALVSATQSSIGIWRLRQAVPWRLALLATGGSMAAMLPGVLLLKRLVAMRPGVAQLVVGAVICAFVTVQWALKIRPRARLHWGWDACAFGGCGLLTGASGMGGPALVLWSMAHDWPAEKTRGLLLTVFTLLTPLQLVLLYAMLGGPMILNGTLLALPLIPTAFLGAAIGLPLGDRLSRHTLRTVGLVLLLVIGLAGIGQALVK